MNRDFNRCLLIGLLAIGAFAPTLAAADQDAASSRPELVRALGHTAITFDVAISPDGKLAATSGLSVAILWDISTGMELRRFGGHGSTMSGVAFSPNGRTIVTTSGDDTARIWDIESGAELSKFTSSSSPGGITAYLPGNQLAFSLDSELLGPVGSNSIRLWDVASGAELHNFSGHNLLVNAYAISPDGNLLLTGGGANESVLATLGQSDIPGGDDYTARLWDVKTGVQLRVLEEHKSSVERVAFSPDGKLGLTGSDDGSAILWQLNTGVVLRRFDEHTHPIIAVAFSPDGQSIFTGGYEYARLWDAHTGIELQRFQGHTSQVSSAAFSPDGQTLLTSGFAQDDNGARLWDVASGEQLHNFSGQTAEVGAVAFSPDGTLIATGSWDNTIWLWDTTTGSAFHRLEGHTHYVTRLQFSPDGQTLLSGSDHYDEIARLWDVSSGIELQQFPGHSSGISAMVFSNNGHTVTIGAGDGTQRIWNISTGTEYLKRDSVPNARRALAYSADGEWAFTGSHLLVGDYGRQYHDDEYPKPARFASTAAISPDNKTVITGGDIDGSLWLWDLFSGAELQKMTGHTSRVESVAISPDGQRAISGSFDSTARLWDLQTGTELQVLAGHSSQVRSVAFSPDGQTVLTGSLDKTTRLWDSTSGEELAQLISFADGSWAVIDPIGRFDASNGGDINGLHWVVGLEPIELSQLKDRYYEPGLLAKIMGFNAEPLREVEAFSAAALYPDVELQMSGPDSDSLDIRLSNRGGGLGRVSVMINGKEIARDARGEGFDSKAADAVISLDLAEHPYVVPGSENSVEVKVYNAEGYLSSRGGQFHWKAPGPKPTESPELWAVVAGVSDYSGDSLDLNYAAWDAVAFSEALERGAQRLFGAQKVHLSRLSTNKESGDLPPTRDNLEQALKGLARAKPTDIVLVYLAGHAVTHGGQDGDYYFLGQQATGFDLDDPVVRSSVALSSEELTELIKLTPANKQVMILDTCGAGRVVERLTEKRGIPSSQIRALDRMKDRTGLFILAGSAADAVSYEASAYGQGLLTYSLLEGMRGAALRDGEYLDVSRWFDYAADRVPAIAENIGGIQRPMVAMPRGSGSFDVARLTETERSEIELKQPLPFVIRAIFQLEGLPIDPLNLSKAVNETMRDVAARGEASSWVFIDTPEYEDGYQLSGRYSVNKTNGEVAVETYLLKENEVVVSETVKGNSAQIDLLVQKIVVVAEKMPGLGGQR